MRKLKLLPRLLSCFNELVYVLDLLKQLFQRTKWQA